MRRNYNESDVLEAKEALDRIIKKSRVHLYKPIQIAEILYHFRVEGEIDLDDVEQYRNRSKKWRDEICIQLLGNVCTSSQKFQDNLFENNAIPPRILSILGSEDVRTGGAVEAYIYSCFMKRRCQLANALSYCRNSTKDTFEVQHLINMFWEEPGLKRSIDKIYEIIVYALFRTICMTMELRVDINVNPDRMNILLEFEDFTKKVMCLDVNNPISSQEANVFRVGTANAADRGLDLYSNWGPAIQVKHLSLDEELAEDIVTSISSDRVIIVCKTAEKGVILSLLTQIGWRSHIQSIITEQDLIEWYEKALRGQFSDQMGNMILSLLNNEIISEFPSVSTYPETLIERGYEDISDSLWSTNNGVIRS